MRRLLITIAALAAVACTTTARSAGETGMTESTRLDWRIVIHGGAGVLLRQSMSADKEAAYRAGLEASLAAGADVLSAGGSAVDAVQAAVIVM